MCPRRRIGRGGGIAGLGAVDPGVERIDPGIERGHVLGARDVQALEHALDPVIEGLLDLVPGAAGLFTGLAEVFLDIVAPARRIAGLLTVAGLDVLAFLDQVVEDPAAFAPSPASQICWAESVSLREQRSA